MDSEKLEQKNRTEIVWGIIVAGFAGFLLNLLANTYYDLFIYKTVTWDKIDHMQILGASLLLLAVIGLLSFFVSDYKNKLEVNRSFLKRYSDYFFYSFTPGKVIRVIVGLYILLTVLAVLGLIYFFIAKVGGYFWATFVMGAAFLKVYLEEKQKTK